LLAVAIAVVADQTETTWAYAGLVLPGLLLTAAVLGGPFATAIAPLAERFSRAFDLSMVELDEELQPIREERSQLEAIPTQDDRDATVLRRLRLRSNRLEEYYTVNLAQARSAFRLSSFALVAGFLMILAGIGLLYAGKSGTSIPAITSVTGVIVELISAGYFYVYRTSIGQVNFFYQNLVREQDTGLAVELIDKLDSSRRDEVLISLITTLMSRKGVVAPQVDPPRTKRISTKE